MKKKMVAVWALAAVLCFGTATISALAAEGWAQSGSTWVYYDSNGNKIYNTWKKGADNQWRYLNGEGVMATNAWVESDYYMDSNGIMLTDKWLKLTHNQYADNESHQPVSVHIGAMFIFLKHPAGNETGIRAV